MSVTREDQIKILKGERRKHTFKEIAGGVAMGACLATFMVQKQANLINLQNIEALPMFSGWFDFIKDYTEGLFRSMRSNNSKAVLDYIVPTNALEGSLEALLAGSVAWIFAQGHKRKKKSEEITNLRLGR